jgi:hypothetical protein
MEWRVVRLQIRDVVMGADLQLSSSVLDDLVAGFAGFGGRLASACADIRSGDDALTGTDPLAGQVHGFAGSWNYGLTQLGQHGQDCVRMLHRVGTTFDRLDSELASQLPQAAARDTKVLGQADGG